MPRYLPEPPARPTLARHRKGVLLVNLGTPDTPTAPAVRRYLKEFLSDPRVVELPALLWQPILRGLILNTRPAKTARKYASIWMPDGSPLLVHSQRMATKLETALENTRVVVAMRYGQPSIATGLTTLREAGCDRIVVLPLYPQYAASTTGSVYDAVFSTLQHWRNQPELRLVRQYYDHPAHVEALKQQVLAYWQQHGRPECLLMSFHGLPQKSTELGDPYGEECLYTGRALADALELPAEGYRITFQSRFGLQKWLQPYTDATLRTLASEGYKRVDTFCPGFPADCLETLEEIAMEGKEAFLAAGGREFHYIPALNDSDLGVTMLKAIVADHNA